MKKVILIFTAAVLMMACQSAQDKMDGAADAAKGAAGDMADAASDAAGDAVDAAADAAGNAVDAATGALTSAYDEAKKALGDNAMSLDTETSVLNWTGTKVTGKHSGTINFTDGAMSMNDDGTCTGVFTVDMTSIANEDAGDGSAKLIGHLSSPDFFDIANNPTATLVISEGKSANGAFTGKGTLTLKGKTSMVDLAGNMAKTDGGMTADVSTSFDRADHDVKYGSGKFFEDLGDNLIHDKVILAGALNFKN